MSHSGNPDSHRFDSNPGGVVIGGDFQGLSVLRSLSKQGIPTLLIDRELGIARFSRHVGRFRKYKCDDDRGLIWFLETLAINEGLQGWVVFANDDETARVLSRYRARLARYYRIPVPAWSVMETVYNKKLTYALAERLGVAAPATFFPADETDLEQVPFGFPLIIKPAIRDHFYERTKTKAIKVSTRAELIDEYRKVIKIIPRSEVMVQEIIPHVGGNLFSFGTVFKDGSPLAKVVARRLRQHPMDFGHATTFAVTTDIPELERLGTLLLRSIDYYGPAEVEFMKDPRDGRFKLLEINPRLWGWHSLAGAAGVDLPLVLYGDMTGVAYPAAKEFDVGVKWVRPITDLPTALGEIIRRRLRIREYFSSLWGSREFAPSLSWDDPLPFLMEFLLLPYLWKKRGF